MRILLLNPPSPFLIDQKAFPPLGLLALAAHVRANSAHTVRVADMAGQEDELETPLADVQADLIGVTASTPQYPPARHIRDILKRLHPSVPVVLGGVHATSAPEAAARDGWDHIVLREGELALVKLADLLQSGAQAPRVLAEPYIDPLDRLPFPAYDLIPVHEYGYRIDGNLAITLMTSRGCPYHCAFCSKEIWVNSVRFHSPEYVERQVRMLMDAYGFRYFLFLDDTVTLKKDRMLDICRRLEPLDIRWRCYAHVKTTDRDMVRAMKRAGCVEIGVGVESGSQEILNSVGKGTTVEQNTAFVRMCREEGVQSNAFVMIGLPGETQATVEATRRWMETARPDKFGYNIFMPYAGTPIYQHPERYDIRLLPVPEEHAWVKGHPGENHCYVETQELSCGDILSLFAENFRYFTELTRWRPGYNERLPGADTSGKP